MATTEVAVPGAVLLTGEEVESLFKAPYAAYRVAQEAELQEWFLGFQTMHGERTYYQETHAALTALQLLAMAQAYLECRSRYATFWRWVPVLGHRLELSIVPQVVAREQELYTAACKAAGLPAELLQWEAPLRWRVTCGPKAALDPYAERWVQVRALLTEVALAPTRQYVVPLTLMEVLQVTLGVDA